jgi:putative toxin-antitoxin system antitoxin component (TIGR02293 family)
MINPEAILRTLGRRRERRQTPADAVIALVRAGIPFRSLDRLAGQLRMPVAELQDIVGVPRATAARKRAAKGTLKPELSDRLVRIANIFTIAREVLESEERAARWLREPNRAMRGDIPLRMLDTEIGAREVEQVLCRLEHGVYS